ncbi:MAG: hypothetical protein V4684_04755 [Pseudomonadota bacterium]
MEGNLDDGEDQVEQMEKRHEVSSFVLSCAVWLTYLHFGLNESAQKHRSFSENERVARAALTLEVLGKQWRQNLVEALAICGHPHGRIATPGTAQATQTDRWFLCLYGKRAGQWEVVREAQNSALRGRTWWSLDQCLQELARRQVVPTELRLLPRGPSPPDFPSLPVETAPTESARRKAPRPVAAKRQPGSPSRVSWLDDPVDGVKAGGVDTELQAGGVGTEDDWDLELKDDDQEEGGDGGGGGAGSNPV